MVTLTTWNEFWHDRPVYQRVGAIIGVILSLFHIYTSLFGCLDVLAQRTIHLGLGLALVFLVYSRGEKKAGVSWIDLLLLIALAAVVAYLFAFYDWVTAERFTMISSLSWYEIILAIAAIILVLESTRRVVGNGLAGIGVVFLLYPFVAPYLPGVLYSTPSHWTAVLDFNYLSLGGIFGIPLGVSATDIALFIIFGAILVRSGGSFLISNVASAFSGRSVGGPAKVAVVASSLMGTISGSATANVATIGSVTIPMMKKAGYKDSFAAAVEAVSSTGGQIMPPIMGAAAFVMSAFSGIAYSDIIIYAIFPAVLYYLSLFVTVDLEARRLKLSGSKPEMTIKETMKNFGHMIIPILVLVYLLLVGYTPRLAGGLGIVTALVACQLRPSTRLNLPTILSALESGAMGMLVVIVSCATAGIIVGSVDLTGLGQRLGAAFISLAGGNLLIGLFLAMLIAMLLGMGLPTTPAYIIQVATVIPALIALGLPPIAAHMFAFYYSCLSLITPPVAAASYTASAIAGSDGWKTGWVAARLGLVAYIVPFMFAYDQSLLLLGSAGNVIVSVITACMGVFCLAVSCEGYFKRDLNLPERIVAGIAAILLIVPSWWLSSIGMVLMAGVLLAAVYAPARDCAKRDKY
ncbi:Sialic acid TRAP transporter permease protein SiaT [Pelotomaculum schinkii]|uniref:Sialic acid TRAP transporter permease protein SiaT n=1 Tax=Pelotomaculum schinkii TaxID=78350 RepID=A0A4Y7REP6_9FIRM|nr:TRAP transporter permease [Pelotomaculum schinkii]TEB07276.1 Sialic acid TRAP transporter permease protein SiaT [Pelotomaculum schinkii]